MNGLISSNQSGFRPGDSTINQHLSITTDIYEAFENFDEVRAVFLDISKAFDKVWHEGLIFKLKQNGVSGRLIVLIESYLKERKQRVVLNGVESEWDFIFSGVPQGSVLGPLLFLIYINDLTDEISSSMKLFADDSSLFARVSDVNSTHEQITTDLITITSWANQWKMKFNPDLSKQAIEVIFSHKHNKPLHPALVFNGIPVAREKNTKHLGIELDERLTFRKHIHNSISKANSGLALMKYLSSFVSRKIIELTYKLYVRPHLDYGDVLYHDQLVDAMKAVESVQYRAGLIITSCWAGTNRMKLYKDLGWETLSERRKYRRFILFYKIKNNHAPTYLSQHIHDLPISMTQRFRNSFFPYCQIGWDSLVHEVRSSNSVAEFKRNYLHHMAIRPQKNEYFNINDRYGMKLLTKLRVDFSDLRAHRFNHHFNCTSPICKCSFEEETTEHFLLRCSRFDDQRRALLESASDIINNDIKQLPNDHITDILLFGSKAFNEISNKLILESTIRYIKSSKRFKIIEAYQNI